MALTKQKKQEVVDKVGELLNGSKITVMATYQGTPVKAMQDLRHQARQSGTTLRVIKNRLVIKALSSSDRFKDIDTTFLQGQILYAFNPEDEVAPAQVIAQFSKTGPKLDFVGAITSDGQLISADDVKALSLLPSKDQLRGQLVGLFASPLSGFVNVLSGNIRGVLNVLNARAESIN